MRHIRNAVAALSMTALAAVLTISGAEASNGPVAQPAGSGQADVRILRGIDSEAELAASCASGKFCAYSHSAGYGLEWGCGRASVPFSGSGWWSNRLSGSRTKVGMLNSSGSRIYTTPSAPSDDSTADWTPVYTLLLCV